MAMSDLATRNMALTPRDLVRFTLISNGTLFHDTMWSKPGFMSAIKSSANGEMSGSQPRSSLWTRDVLRAVTSSLVCLTC